ncbi:hypothetical protein HYW75_02385 [Candidatus Pacearchaeota archaeon]|nr:hypothetical protein [Candidatus Pacearchaeota archaeon]
MIIEETERKIQDAETLLKKLERVEKFSNKYELTPSRETKKLVESMGLFADSIQKIENPTTLDLLFLSELKRRLDGEAAYLEHRLSGELYDFNTVVNILGIPQEDILFLRPWLEANKEKTQEAVERLFHSRDIEGYELPLASDIPSVRRQVEEFAGAHIQRYHKTLGKFFHGLTKVGAFLRDINAAPTTQERSYFNSLTNTLAISISSICFSKEDGILHVKEKELIRIYGHEGMGHALNYFITISNGLPYFLTHRSALTSSTAESVAQFYENVLLEDLKKSQETQRALGIEHKFAEIYQETKDTEQLEEYRKRIFQYGISVLGNKSLGEPNNPSVLKKKADLIYEVAIDKSGVQSWIQSNRYNFDSDGNLNPKLVSELRYCARPVHRALEEFIKCGINYDEKGRDIIDSTLLKGLWTPIGFVDNARLIAGLNN